MKVTKISYGRTLNRDDFNSERMEIMVELEEDEKASAAVKSAKLFLDRELGKLPRSARRRE